jgi:hypothetical protein
MGADPSILNAVSHFMNSGMIKFPSGVTTANVVEFLASAAQSYVQLQSFHRLRFAVIGAGVC